MGAGHDHGSRTGNRTRLAVAFGITASLVVVQFVGSIVTGSLAISLLGSTAAMFVAREASTRRLQLVGGLVLTLAICGLHHVLNEVFAGHLHWPALLVENVNCISHGTQMTCARWTPSSAPAWIPTSFSSAR